MKLLYFLCFVGLASAATPLWQFEEGKEYLFHYQGRILTGIPQLDSHYAGLGIQSEVIIQVKNLEDVRLGLNNVNFSQVNGKLGGSPADNLHYGRYETNWRFVDLKDFKPAPQELLATMKLPVSFSLKDGEIVAVSVSSTETEWSVNFKKALIVLFQSKMETSTLDLNLNSISKENHDTKTYWKVAETTMEGVCDVTYQVNQLSDFAAKEHSIYNKGLCSEGHKYFEVIKTKDVDSCERSPIYTFQKPSVTHTSCNSFKCLSNMIGSITSITRYFACGPSRSSLGVQYILNEGEIVQKPTETNSEVIVSGVRQVLSLEKMGPISQELPQVSDPKTSESLMYEYMPMESIPRQNIGQIPHLPKENLKQGELYKYLPRHFMPSPSDPKVKGKMVPQAIKDELKAELQKIIADLANPVDLGKKEIPLRLSSMIRGLVLFKVEDLKALYTELKETYASASYQQKKMFENIFFDAVMVSGTTPAVMFLKEMIISKEVPTLRAISTVMMMPHHIITPTQEVFDSLFELLGSEVVQSNSMFYNNLLLAMSNIVQKACIEPNNEISYPTAVFGRFCEADSPIVLEKWLPYLHRQLQTASTEERRKAVIVALGALGHKQVIPIILPIIEGDSFNDYKQSHKNVSRSIAVYSLVKAGRVHKDLVMPTLYTIYRNSVEETEVRVAAVNAMFILQPSLAYLQKIAASSFYERDNNVKSLIYTIIENLAETKTTSMAMGVNSPQANLINNCRLVLPSIKKFWGPVTLTKVIDAQSYLYALNAGSMSTLSWISNYKSIIPSHLYMSVVSIFGGRYTTRPFEMAFNIEGTEKLLSKFFMNKLHNRVHGSGQQGSPNMGGRYNTESRKQALLRQSVVEQADGNWDTASKQNFDAVKDSLHQEWAKVIEQLKIETKKSGPLAGLVLLNLFDDVTFFTSISNISEDMIAMYASYLTPEALSKVCGATPISYQRLVNPYTIEAMIPTDMGFPIFVEKNTPTLLSISGSMNVNCNQQEPSVTLKMNTAAAVNYHAHIGVYSPFTGESILAGIKQDFVLNLPLHSTIGLEAKTGALKFNLKVMEEVNGPLNLIYARTLPFTTISPVVTLTPKCLSENTKFIKSDITVKSMEMEFGKSVGLAMKSHMEIETRNLDATYALRLASFYNYNPLNALKHFMAPNAINPSNLPSVRYAVFKLNYDPASSANKEMTIVIKGALATILSPKTSTYQAITVKSFDEINNEECPFFKVNPFKIISMPLGTVPQEHADRQNILKSLMESKLELLYGNAAILNVEADFKGSSAKTFEYQLAAALGYDKTGVYKTHLQAENPKQNEQKICLKAYTLPPPLPVWDIGLMRSIDLSIDFHSDISYGQNCGTPLIKVDGNARTSMYQKQLSKMSPYAKVCQRELTAGVPGAFFSYNCLKTMTSAKTLDVMDLKIKYLQPSPMIHSAETGLTRLLQAYLWNYVSEAKSFTGPASAHIRASETSVQLKFNEPSETVDLVITRPEDHVLFKNIRYPSLVAPVLPVSLSDSTFNKVFHSECRIEKSWMRTYDNISYPFALDDCFHLVSGDCSGAFEYGVLARAIRPESQAKEMKFYLNKTEVIIKPTDTYTQSAPHLSIMVNREEQQIEKTEVKYIMDPQNEEKVLLSIYKSIDGVVQIYSPSTGYRVNFDGVRISIQSPTTTKNDNCGVCGDNNGQDFGDVKGPTGCIYSEPRLAVASYRVPTSECSPMNELIKRAFDKETEVCSRYSPEPTEVIKGFLSMVGKCTKKQHLVLERGQEVCFSKAPVIQCAAHCSPKPAQMTPKKMEFACMKVDSKFGELYKEKVVQGQVLPELKNNESAFVTSVLVPQSCTSVAPELSLYAPLMN